MRRSKDTVGSKTDRTRPRAAGFALAILVIAAGVSHPSRADTPSSPPPTDCTDFACEK